jgi:hypothetical protein
MIMIMTCKVDLLMFLKTPSSFFIMILQISLHYRPDPPAVTYKSLPLPPPPPQLR